MVFIVCLLLNLKLCVFDDMVKYMLKVLFDCGVVVMINFDDLVYFGGYVNENYFVMVEGL